MNEEEKDYDKEAISYLSGAIAGVCAMSNSLIRYFKNDDIRKVFPNAEQIIKCVQILSSETLGSLKNSLIEAGGDEELYEMLITPEE